MESDREEKTKRRRAQGGPFIRAAFVPSTQNVAQYEVGPRVLGLAITPGVVIEGGSGRRWAGPQEDQRPVIPNVIGKKVTLVGYEDENEEEEQEREGKKKTHVMGPEEYAAVRNTVLAPEPYAKHPTVAPPPLVPLAPPKTAVRPMQAPVLMPLPPQPKAAPKVKPMPPRLAKMTGAVPITAPITAPWKKGGEKETTGMKAGKSGNKPKGEKKGTKGKGQGMKKGAKGKEPATPEGKEERERNFHLNLLGLPSMVSSEDPKDKEMPEEYDFDFEV